jgi:hypothetical protein
MTSKMLPFLLLLLAFSCKNNGQSIKKEYSRQAHIVSADENPYERVSAIPLPDGFRRSYADTGSFAYWLRQMKLKKDRTVHLYDGSLKRDQSAQFAVLNVSVGEQNLQQCADAVMRLRAEYLFSRENFSDILFIDNEGGRYQFSSPYTRQHFDQYLLKVFGMCGSASLAKQLHRIEDIQQLQPGDVLIRGGFPGHAVIVMDVAQDSSGQKIFLLAQSYMPAQDIHLLQNPINSDRSPWYDLTDESMIVTPEYLFDKSEWRRW